MLCLALLFPRQAHCSSLTRITRQHRYTTLLHYIMCCTALYCSSVLHCIAQYCILYCVVYCNTLHYIALQFTYCVTKNAHRDSIDYTLSNKEILFDSLSLFPLLSIPFPNIPSVQSSHLFCSIMLSLTLLCSPVLFCSPPFCSALLISPPLSLTLLSFSLLCLPVMSCTVLFCPDPEAAVHRPEGSSPQRVTDVASAHSAPLGTQGRAFQGR